MAHPAHFAGPHLYLNGPCSLCTAGRKGLPHRRVAVASCGHAPFCAECTAEQRVGRCATAPWPARKTRGSMNIKNKLGRAAGIAAAAAAIGGLGLVGVASASTDQPTAVTSVATHATASENWRPVSVHNSQKACVDDWIAHYGSHPSKCAYYTHFKFHHHLYHHAWVLFIL